MSQKNLGNVKMKHTFGEDLLLGMWRDGVVPRVARVGRVEEVDVFSPQVGQKLCTISTVGQVRC